MATTLKPEMEARIAADAKVSPPRRKMTPEEIAAEKAHWLEIGRQLRAKYPYDDDHPPSKVWQEELYDEQGLPK